MRELTAEELKMVELDILKNVASFCDKNNIRYSLGGGTLLGAIRHKGFIPWDDDIDIMMPRPDYIKFLNTYNQSTEKYVVKAIENDAQYWRTFAKVFDNRTVLIEDTIRIPTPGNGVFVDVFPVDGLPCAKWKQQILFKVQEFLNFLYHGSAWNYTKSLKYADSKSSLASVKGNLRTILKFIAITLLYPLPTHKLIRLINWNASRTQYDYAKEVAAIVDCHYGGSREKMIKADFEIQIPVIFEGETFWAMGAYKEYLTNMYGDYMQPPPKEKQVTHHDFTAYWKD